MTVYHQQSRRHHLAAFSTGFQTCFQSSQQPVRKMGAFEFIESMRHGVGDGGVVE